MVAKKARRGTSGKQIESVGAVLLAIAAGSPFGAAGRSRTTVGGRPRPVNHAWDGSTIT